MHNIGWSYWIMFLVVITRNIMNFLKSRDDANCKFIGDMLKEVKYCNDVEKMKLKSWCKEHMKKNKNFQRPDTCWACYNKYV